MAGLHHPIPDKNNPAAGIKWILFIQIGEGPRTPEDLRAVADRP
jgi:hypothetical protein